jgi:hypothetical protein
MQKHVILFLAANPSGMNSLALDQECRAVQQELRLSTDGRFDFRLESRWAASIDDLGRHLLELDPTVIHFSGHGGGSQGLFFQAEDGAPQIVSARALQQIIESTACNARVAVLNACYSIEQAYALRCTVDCVVGMTSAISDVAARSFAVAFYRVLGYRRSVGNAFSHAVAILRAKGHLHESDTWLSRDIKPGVFNASDTNSCTPQCLTRDGVDAYKIMLPMISTNERFTESACELVALSGNVTTLGATTGENAKTSQICIVLKATLSRFRAAELASVLAELQRLSGDITLQIRTSKKAVSALPW